MDPIRIGVIGGSGLYTMPEVTDVSEVRADTPFGLPSDALIVGRLHGQQVAFLPRHGRGHVHNPSEVPYRANIYALKALGVTHVISVSACGSLKESHAPGSIVIPDQLYDFTKDTRGRTFFERGLVAHVGVADPFCGALSALLAAASREAGAVVHEGGTSITIEGPRFSTRAESNVWRQLGFAIIGMTTSPEAFLAREAEMHYAVMAHVTDYDVWHEEPVNAEMVFKQFHANIALAQRAVALAVQKVAATFSAEAAPASCGCDSALAMALATARERITPETRTQLGPIISKYISD